MITFAHFIGDSLDIQVQRQLGPSTIRLDTVSPGDVEYEIVLERVLNERFDAPKAYPPQPSDFHEWSEEENAWFDPRTEQDRLAELQRAREATDLSRMEFVERAMEWGILDPSEAAQAARGDIPTSFIEVVASMSPMEQAYVDIRWPAATRISRVDSLILRVAEIKQYSDDMLDELFEVKLP